MAATRGAAQGRAECAADHDRRRRLRRAKHLRRRRPDAGAGPHREERPALHEFPLDVAVLADARGDHHRPQPPLGGFRRGRRDRHRLPRLRLDHSDREGHHRHDPQIQRLFHLVVRQGPQHAVLRQQPGRALRTVAERHGLRVLLRLRRRRRQPVAAEPVPQHDADLSLPGQSGLEPDHGHGRRGDPAHEAVEGARAREALLRLLRAGRHARAAPPDARVDPEDQRHAPVRRRLGKAARDDLRQPEAAGHHAGERPAHAVAGRAGDLRWRKAAPVGLARLGAKETLHQASECLRGVPGLHRSRDRPRHPVRRRPGPTRQHADHLHQRRQRRERRRHDQRHAQRVHHLQRHRGAGQGPVPLVRVLGVRPDLSRTFRRRGPGRSTHRSSG